MSSEIDHNAVEFIQRNLRSALNIDFNVGINHEGQGLIIVRMPMFKYEHMEYAMADVPPTQFIINEAIKEAYDVIKESSAYAGMVNDYERKIESLVKEIGSQEMIIRDLREYETYFRLRKEITGVKQ